MMQKDGVVINDTVGRKQQVQVVNESGLYHLTITSRKEFARRFRKWLTAEVASGIHKYGIDVINEAILTPSQPGSDNSHNKNQAKNKHRLVQNQAWDGTIIIPNSNVSQAV